jgi:NAD(P)-dependent dehydrogenase (short-subunit alcohol dehydrogenase family)
MSDTGSEAARRIAVVTGAARGIGRAVAEALAETGAPVAAVDLREPAETATAIEAAGGRCRPYVADISDPVAVERLAAAVREELGACTILVNNAALLLDPEPLLETGWDSWCRQVAVNLGGQFLTVKSFAPGMIELGWGRIINVSSAAIYTTAPGLTPYMATKGGVLAFTRGVANELGPHGITANAVSPGLTLTPPVVAGIARGAFPEGIIDTMVAVQPIKRPSEPRDLANLVVFLASDQAGFITGQFLAADGGVMRI